MKSENVILAILLAALILVLFAILENIMTHNNITRVRYNKCIANNGVFIDGNMQFCVKRDGIISVNDEDFLK